MGEVWRATDISLGRTVAVKVLRPALLTDPGFDARFRTEARTMAALTHPNVVNVYDYGRSPLTTGSSVAYLVMAYVDGEPLSSRIADAGRLSVAETMSVVAQSAEALHAAHLRGIVHRDVKPGNLLVRPNGTVILVDFGVAQSTAATQVTTANGVLGTATYMAPEQASGRAVSPATDIYALGVVAYHCLAGEPPFRGGSALEIALQHVSNEPPPLPADVPPAAQMLVAEALAKDPAARYASAAEFAAAARAVTASRRPARAAAGFAGTMMPGKVIPGEFVPGKVIRSAAISAPRSSADAAVLATEPGPPTTPDLPALASTPPGPQPRRPRGGPRIAAVAGVAAALLVGLVTLATLLSPAQPAGTGPAEGAERTAGPTAPAGNPATVAPARSGRAGPAAPVGAGGSAPAPPPAGAPAGQPAASTGPAAPAGPNPTGAPSARPSPSPSATTSSAAPTPTASAAANSSPNGP
jgi:serine/threonine-protein kinase